MRKPKQQRLSTLSARKLHLRNSKRAGGSSQGGAASSRSTSGQPPYLVRRRVDSIFTFLQLYTLSLGELLASESILSPLQPYCKDRNNYEYYFFWGGLVVITILRLQTTQANTLFELVRPPVFNLNPAHPSREEKGPFG